MLSAARAAKKVAFTSLLLPVLVFSQTRTKAQELMYVGCDRDSCSFTVQSNSSEEMKFYYGTHLSLFHKERLSDEQILSLVKHGEYEQQNSSAKSISCPEKDGFAIWAAYDDVLVFFFAQHAQFVHDKELKDLEVRKLITSIQK